MNEAPSGTQAAVILLSIEGQVAGIPVFVPTDLGDELYSFGAAFAQSCWPQANYLYTELGNY